MRRRGTAAVTNGMDKWSVAKKLSWIFVGCGLLEPHRSRHSTTDAVHRLTASYRKRQSNFSFRSKGRPGNAESAFSQLTRLLNSRFEDSVDRDDSGRSVGIFRPEQLVQDSNINPAFDRIALSVDLLVQSQFLPFCRPAQASRCGVTVIGPVPDM